MDVDELAHYSSPLVVSFSKEVDEAIRVCFYLIDKPPKEYRLVQGCKSFLLLYKKKKKKQT